MSIPQEVNFLFPSFNMFLLLLFSHLSGNFLLFIYFLFYHVFSCVDVFCFHLCLHTTTFANFEFQILFS
jgi:hypothetical protein